jgi:hypothetical protein
VTTVTRPADRCLLCDRRPTYVGIWVPTPAASRRLGAAAGKQRLARYALCRRCRHRRGAVGRVEERILSEVAAALARPDAN